MNVTLRNTLKFTEFILLFFGVPLYIYFDTRFEHPNLIILPVIVIILIYLYRQPGFHLRELLKINVSARTIAKHVLTILVVFVLMFVAVYYYERHNLFNLPKSNPRVYLLLFVFYPLFSAYGQEIIYRTFLYYRYREIFRTKTAFVLAGSIAFSFAHIIYYSHISISLTFMMGIYLNLTYLGTKSVLFTAILHGILGNIVFAVGLGGYFWLDMHKWM